MEVGDLVKIIAPESVVGWPAGKVGLVTTVLANGLTDYVVGVASSEGLKSVYVHHREIKAIDESR